MFYYSVQMGQMRLIFSCISSVLLAVPLYTVVLFDLELLYFDLCNMIIIVCCWADTVDLFPVLALWLLAVLQHTVVSGWWNNCN